MVNVSASNYGCIIFKGGRKIKQQPTQATPELQLSLEDVPVDGALGLLAYGDLGLVAWRDKRAQIEGPDWRQKLAEELSSEEKALKDSAMKEDSDERD